MARDDSDRAGPQVVTFGCRLNAYESEVIRENGRQAGATDTVVVNTCAVTGEAERQARQAVRKARRANPDKRVVVTGCAAQIHPDSFAEMDEVDQVLGNEEKLQPGALAPDPDSAKIRVNDIMSARTTAGHLIEGFGERARAFVQVQQGCDHRCTFCIIPYGRGPSRSVPLGEIVQQVRQLVAAGYREIVLSGVDITSYGADLPGRPSLGQMVRRLLAQVPELERLRLSSLDAVEIDADLWRLIAEEPRLMPHLHLSLQAGDDLILKRMKRRHSRDQALALIEGVRRVRPDTAFGADLIAGFPTESEAMFANTCGFVDQAGLAYLHVFPFSERPGTPAAKMPQVPGDVRKARAKQLRELGEAQRRRFFDALVGAELDVLTERAGSGRCANFAPVTLASPVPAGERHRAICTGHDGQRLQARLAGSGAEAAA